MKTEIHLRYIHQKYHNITEIYDTKQEIEVRANFHFRLPKIITWKRIIRLSIIIGICKEFFCVYNESEFVFSLSKVIEQNKVDLKNGFIKRYYGNLKDLPKKNPPINTKIIS